MSTAKKSKTAAFSRVFTQINSAIFLGKSKVEFFGQKMKISNSVISDLTTRNAEVISKYFTLNALYAEVSEEAVVELGIAPLKRAFRKGQEVSVEKALEHLAEVHANAEVRSR